MFASKTRHCFSIWRLYSTLWSEHDQIPKPCLYNPLQTYNQQLIQPTPAPHNCTKLAYENSDEKAREQDAKKGSNPICFPPKIITNSPINTLLHHTFKRLAFGERLAKREKRKQGKPSQIQNKTFCSSPLNQITQPLFRHSRWHQNI